MSTIKANLLRTTSIPTRYSHTPFWKRKRSKCPVCGKRPADSSHIYYHRKRRQS